MADKKLTPKQEKFCQNVVLTGNQSEAYRIAYNTKAASHVVNVKASELMQHCGVSVRVAELRKEAEERSKITIDECVSLLADLARFDINDLYNEEGGLKPLNEIPIAARRSITGLETEQAYKWGSEGKIPDGFIKKIRTTTGESAIDKLMKHLGGYEKDNRQKEQIIVLTHEEREAKKAAILKRENNQ